MNILNNLGKKLKSSFALGDNFFYKIKLFLVFILFSIKRRLGIKSNYPIKLKLRKFGKSFYLYVTDGLDLAIFEEIFVKDEYGLQLKKNPSIIFDLGSNIGLSVVYFKLRYPDAKIYAFEPDPKTFKSLEMNTKQFKDIYCFNLAISDKNGTERFYVYPNSSMSLSLIKRLDNEPFIEVEVKKLDTLMEDLKIEDVDLLKIDVEGFEYNVFREFKNIIRVGKIIGEVHIDLMENVTKESFLSVLNDFNVVCNDVSKKRFVIDATNKKNNQIHKSC